MNDKFDELAKGMAQSVTRRSALKFGVGVAGMALAVLGLPTEAQAAKPPFHCRCGEPNYGCDPNSGTFAECTTYCGLGTGRHQCGGGALVRLLRKLLP